MAAGRDAAGDPTAVLTSFVHKQEEQLDPQPETERLELFSKSAITFASPQGTFHNLFVTEL